MMAGMKVAKVSSVHRDTGMVSVVDQDGSATDHVPFFAFGGEYHPPCVGDMVLVADLPDGLIVLGGFWNRARKPPDPDVAWIKEIDQSVSMKSRDGVVTISARDLVLDTGEKRISLAELTGGE